MSIIKTPFEIGIQLEKAGYFQLAYSYFKDCMPHQKFDLGDIYFHCGWCAENLNYIEKNTAIENYLQAGKLSLDTSCRANGYFRAGWIFMHLDKNKNAINCFLNSIEFSKDDLSTTELYSDSLYWCAICFERENRIIDAIGYYRKVKENSKRLNPESRYRELMCLITIGSYTESLEICQSFEFPAPDGFSLKRYSELKKLADNEKKIIEACLSTEFKSGNYANS